MQKRPSSSNHSDYLCTVNPNAGVPTLISFLVPRARKQISYTNLVHLEHNFNNFDSSYSLYSSYSSRKLLKPSIYELRHLRNTTNTPPTSLTSTNTSEYTPLPIKRDVRTAGSSKKD